MNIDILNAHCGLGFTPGTTSVSGSDNLAILEDFAISGPWTFCERRLRRAVRGPKCRLERQGLGVASAVPFLPSSASSNEPLTGTFSAARSLRFSRNGGLVTEALRKRRTREIHQQSRVDKALKQVVTDLRFSTRMREGSPTLATVDGGKFFAKK